MHLVFERSKGLFKSNCNILALAWMPYYDETKFRQALFDYHQRQLINLTSSIAASYPPQANQNNNNNQVGQLSRTHQIARHQNSSNNNNNNLSRESRDLGDSSQNGTTNQSNLKAPEFNDSRLSELYSRYMYLKQESVQSLNNNINTNEQIDCSVESIHDDLGLKYGKNSNFGWLAIGNVGKFVGITLTTLLNPPIETTPFNGYRNRSKEQNNGCDEDLIKFNNETDNIDCNVNNDNKDLAQISNNSNNPANNLDRPDKNSNRTNYNLRGHLDEIILVKWNDLYQKLATIDSKGNVLIWCKINEKFTIQTPFYNRTKSVADFKWSNDGKTALICYTDSFILVGSSSGQRHWHSMLNLDDYHITCASWTPNDEQLLLGVSNGNVVVIDLPHSELTELVVNQCNIRTMCWSSSDLNLKDHQRRQLYQRQATFDVNSRRNPNYRRGSSNIVNQRRLSRDCSVFSRYRLCSQGVPNISNNNNNNSNNSRQQEAGGGQEELSSLVETNEKLACLEDNCSLGKGQNNILAIDFANNSIKLYDGGLNDPEPKVIQVNQESYIMNWSNNGKILAVAGFTIHTTAPSIGYLKCRYLNTIKFYDQTGQLIHEHAIRFTRFPITAFTWAHDDRRIFLATGPKLYCAKVFYGVPSLNLLATSCLFNNTKLLTKVNLLENIVNNCKPNQVVLKWQSYNCPIDIYEESNLRKKQKNNEKKKITRGSEHDNRQLLINHLSSSSCSEEDISVAASGGGKSETFKYINWNNSNVQKYTLPPKLQLRVDDLFSQTIRQPYDERWTFNDIIWHVPKNEQRYFCTLICYTSDKDLNSSGYQYRAEQISLNKITDNNHNQATSDKYKIFVLYVEFQGSLIPILRARRVGFLKPEFIIYDPEDQDRARLLQRQQRKVSDISQQSSSLFMNTTTFSHQQQQQNKQAKFMAEQVLTNQINMQQNNNSPSAFYHNDAFGENCSDLHLYSEARPSSSATSLGRQSMSDAEYYYNFENPNERHNSNPLATATTTTSAAAGVSFNNQSDGRMSDLASGRSHHQEPMVLPISSNQYLFYMLAMNQSSMNTRQQFSHLDHQSNNNNNNNNKNVLLSNNNSSSKRRHKNNGLSSMLNENNELARVRSNIWGTKFKLVNVGNRMIKQRSVIAAVVYKASILHLQPRQIFLNIKDMSNYCCLCSKHHHVRVIKQKSSCHLNVNEKNKNNNFISLMDIPNNFNSNQTTSSPMRRQSNQNLTTAMGNRRKGSNNHHQNQNKNDNKVIVPVGDSIRIAPKLEKNQRYKYNNSNFLYDNQRPSTSREHNNTKKHNQQQFTSNINTNKIKANQHYNNNSNKSILKLKQNISLNDKHYSETHASRYTKHRHHHHHQHNNNDKTSNSNHCVRTLFDDHDEKKQPSNDHEEDSNDLLTLSFDESHKIMVEMFSSSLPNNKSIEQEPEESKGVDEFIAANKTLKSIQSITKMILDLSSKAHESENEEFSSPSNGDKKQFDKNIETTVMKPSPSKLIKLNDEGISNKNNNNSPSISCKYIAPSAPVHKPRRQAQASRLNGQACEEARFLTQSATTTPLKGSNKSSHSNHNRHRSKRCSTSSSSSSRRKDSSLSAHDFKQYSLVSNPLPPPPPSMPISRKLSSRAKRFFDGSVRSLYGGAYSSSGMSDLDPDEDNEPLITNFQLKARAKRLAYNALETPIKSNRCPRDKQTLDHVSLKEKLLKGFGMRGNYYDASSKSVKQKNNHSISTSQLDKYTDNFNQKFRQTNKSFKTTKHHDKEQYLESNNNNDNSSFSDDLWSSSSSSDLSLFDSDTDFDEIIENKRIYANITAGMGNKLTEVRKRFLKYPLLSSSVRNLQDFEKKNNERFLAHKEMGKDVFDRQSGNSGLEGRRKRIRRHRKKSICSNQRCCCSKEFKLNNRPPVWNESSQVYQLDFGGRVTQESAKNLQIDFEGNLALQFGRIDKCTYTLDYKYPFNAVQAMAIALASLTQRLK